MVFHARQDVADPGGGSIGGADEDFGGLAHDGVCLWLMIGRRGRRAP
jgi:hypothetical protein